MSGKPFGFHQMELKFISERKQALPPHAGEARYQQALDRDRAYREMILASFALALIGATSFSQISSVVGPYQTALMSIAATGLALRSICPRIHPPVIRRNLVEGSVRRLWIVSLVLFGILGSMLGGSNAPISVGVVVAFTILAWIITAVSQLRWLAYFLSSIAMVCAVVWILAFRSTGIDVISAPIALALGVLVVASSLFNNWSQSSEFQPVLLLTSFAGYLWITMASISIVSPPWHLAVCTSAFACYGFIERQLSTRSAFAPVIVTIILLHLTGFICWQAGLGKAVAPQIVLLLLEFCLLGMAGYRHALAALSKYPRATYRSSPQCLVPTLDHAWDHPMRIDAT